MSDWHPVCSVKAPIGHAAAERTTFVVMPDGKIAATIGGIAPKDNVMKALEAVEQLAKKD